MTLPLTIRPATLEDQAFLYQVYASTRAVEMQLVPWSESDKHHFFTLQFQAQHQFYRAQFPQAAFQIVLLDQQPVGRFYVDRRPNEIRLIDIALLPTFQHQGIGTQLLSALLAEGKSLNLPVHLYVETCNPAWRFYHRLGFQTLETYGLHYFMAWIPSTCSSP